MTSPIGGFAPIGIGAATGATAATAATTGAAQAQGTDGFSSVLAATFDKLQGTQAASDQLAAQAATGDLKDVHDYMIARNEASLATEMVVTFKNQAVSAFNEIMRMQL